MTGRQVIGPWAPHNNPRITDTRDGTWASPGSMPLIVDAKKMRKPQTGRNELQLRSQIGERCAPVGWNKFVNMHVMPLVRQISSYHTSLKEFRCSYSAGHTS